MDYASELLKLAEEKFGKLTEAEEKLFRDTTYNLYSQSDTNILLLDKRILKKSYLVWVYCRSYFRCE